MKRTLSIVLTLMAAMLLLAVPALAITSGTPDDEEHPYVGVVIFTATRSTSTSAAAR